jgi:DNA processing protein
MTEPPAPELLDWLALSLVPNLGPRLTAALLRRFGSPAAIRRSSPSQLRTVPHVGEKLAADFARCLRDLDLTAEVARLERHRVGLLGWGLPGYPPTLTHTFDPPHLLYVRGALEGRDSNAVAIVGSRKMTPYGRRMTERLAAGLARAGVTVVSGLARGIDGVAHKAALEAGGRTVAVLAGGLSRIYPPEHADLADAVAASGALLTETPLTMSPQPGMFPARNRIISGLSRGVLIVEAGEKSGALITAEHAAEQGREVFALPGPADSEASAGCLRLLRDGARLVRDADDILEDLRGIAPLTDTPSDPGPRDFLSPAGRGESPPTALPTEPPGLDPTQRRIWELLAPGPRHIDVMARELELPVAQLNGLLMLLEMRKVVRRLPGNQYERR